VPIANAWDRITDAGPAAVVLVGATIALLALPIVRWLAPRGHRHRGGPARFFLGLAVVLAVSAIGLGTMGAASPGNVLQLIGVLALMMGLVGMAGLLVFDVVLPRLRIGVPSIVRDLLLVTIAVAIGMGFLRLAGLDVFSLVTTSAVLTAVIGLALQTTIANVFSGLSLQVDRTLRHGEWIEVGSRVGKILEIGWRSTRIQTKDGDTVFVPNSELVSKEVLNFGQTTGKHRMTIRVGFHYRHPPSEVRRVLLAAIRGIPGVLNEPPADCGPAEFGDSAVVYVLRYWIADFARDTTIDEEVHARIWYAARRADLEIPPPTLALVNEAVAANARAAAEEQERAEALRLLGAADPFSRLDAESRRRCAHGVRRLEFTRGEHVLEPEETDDCLYVIDSGEVAVQRRSNGSTPETTTLRAGEVVGRRLLPRHDSCTARSEAVLYRLDGRALDEVLATDQELGARLSAIATARQGGVDGSGGAGVEPSVRLPVRIQRLFQQT
jgi:small-conductance mechanosensitive channel